MRRAVLYLLCVLLVACAAGVVVQTYRLQQHCAECEGLTKRVEELEATLERERATHRQQVDAHVAECRALRVQVERMKAAAPAAQAAFEPGTNGVGRAAIDYMNGLTRLLDTPDVRAQTRQRIERRQVVAVYAEFLDGLLLPAEQVSEVRALLVDRMIAEWGPNLELFDPHASREQRDAARAYATNAQARIDAQVIDIVGPEAATRYREYADTERERMLVASLNQSLVLDPRHVMTRQQRNRLVELMHTEWERVRATPGYVDLSHAGPCEITPESVEQFYRHETNAIARINLGAQEFLSEYQYGALTAFHAAAVHDMETRIGLMLAMSATMDAEKEAN